MALVGCVGISLGGLKFIVLSLFYKREERAR